MADDNGSEASIGAIRCECGGEMHPSEVLGEQGGGRYTVECEDCGGIGGVNISTMDTYGAVDRLEIVGE